VPTGCVALADGMRCFQRPIGCGFSVFTDETTIVIDFKWTCPK
jgi:hypothetical protein